MIVIKESEEGKTQGPGILSVSFIDREHAIDRSVNGMSHYIRNTTLHIIYTSFMKYMQ